MERVDNFETINNITEVILLPVIRGLKKGTKFTVKDITPSIILNVFEENKELNKLGRSLGDFVETDLINVKATNLPKKDNCIVYIKE